MQGRLVQPNGEPIVQGKVGDVIIVWRSIAAIHWKDAKLDNLVMTPAPSAAPRSGSRMARGAGLLVVALASLMLWAAIAGIVVAF